MLQEKLTRKDLAAQIDHTLLKPGASRDQILELCSEAKKYHFASVCVNSCWIPLVASELQGSGVAPCTVIGFPLGACLTSVKVKEAADSIANGAEEIDMVINIGAVKSGDWELVRSDIAAVNDAKGNAKLKVIIETCLLTDEEKVHVCEIAKEVGVDFVKTSTGFSTGGATAHDVALMRKTVGEKIGVKASGGVRTLDDALTMLNAGASRLGASAGVAIVEAL